MIGRGDRSRENKRGIDDRFEESKFSQQPSNNNTCNLQVNHFRLSLKGLYAYLIDWGKNIP